MITNKLYRLHQMHYGPTDMCALFTVEISEQLGDCITLGHTAHGDCLDNLCRYKIIEHVGNEIHEHLMLTFGSIGQIAHSEDYYIIRTRIVAPNEIRILNYTQPIIDVLHNLSGYKQSERLVPIQIKLLHRLRNMMLYYFTSNTEAYDTVNNVIRIFDCLDRCKFTTIPSKLSEITSMIHEMTSLYTLLIHNPTDINLALREISKTMMFDRLVYPVGMACQLVNGNTPLLERLTNPVLADGREYSSIYSDVLEINPHLKDTVTGATDVWFDLIEMLSNAKFTDFSITFDLVERLTIRVNFYRNYEMFAVSIPYECNPFESGFNVLGIDYDKLMACIDFLIKTLKVSIRGNCLITICKTFNEFVSINFDVTPYRGKPYRITYVIDMVLSYIMNPSLVYMNPA